MGNTTPGLRAALLGHRSDGRPIWWHRGANDGSILVEDETDDTDELDDDADDDEPDDTDGADSWKPPNRAEYEKLQADLAAQRRTNRELGQIRAALRRNGINPDDLKKNGRRPAPPADHDEPDEPDEPAKPAGKTFDERQVQRRVDREVTRATASVEGTYKPVVIQLALKAALLDAGWTGKDLNRVMKMVDEDAIEVESGEVIGLEDQIEGIKEEFPEWFRKRREPEADGDETTRGRGTRRRPPAARRGAREIDGGDVQPPQEPKTWKEHLASRLA